MTEPKIVKDPHLSDLEWAWVDGSPSHHWTSPEPLSSGLFGPHGGRRPDVYPTPERIRMWYDLMCSAHPVGADGP